MICAAGSWPDEASPYLTVDGRPEALNCTGMRKLERGTGSTTSERYLARLADRTFLNLWSYPNAFNDRGATDAQHGKELCDLLVVCGDDVLIFSDKSVTWPSGEDTSLCWARWYRRAVEHSIKQLRGAERWLRLYPERIFIDPACSCRLPAPLPPPDRLRVHLIAIALGAQDACSKHYNDRNGSLMVATNLQGSAHTNPQDPQYRPFCFGDVEPSGSFVHVFDETALTLVMREMDTVSDFVRYLSERAAAIREQRVFMAASEAEMLAFYLSHEDADGAHVFPTVLGPYNLPEPISLVAGHYAEYRASEACRVKTAANRVSYAWDRLITTFSNNVIAGTSVAIDGAEPRADHAERALRGMALENRTMRRALAETFLDALRVAEVERQDRFARVVLPMGCAADPECAYVFLVMAFRPEWLAKRGYEGCRRMRSGMLRAYGEAVLYDHRHLKRVIGIALDASSRVTGRKGGSEDLMLLERTGWTPEAEEEVQKLRNEVGILLPENVRRGTGGTQEYPVPMSPPGAVTQRGSATYGNRRDRRAATSKARRKRR